MIENNGRGIVVLQHLFLSGVLWKLRVMSAATRLFLVGGLDSNIFSPLNIERLSSKIGDEYHKLSLDTPN